MAASMREPPVALRASLIPRAIGVWMCVVAVAGFVLVLALATVAVASVVGLVWSVPGFWWGWRRARSGVFVEPDELVVRNPFRTHRVAYDEIGEVRVHHRLPGNGPSRALARLVDPRVGKVDLRGGERSIELSTTSSFLPVFRRSGDRTADDVAAIRSRWLERAGAT